MHKHNQTSPSRLTILVIAYVRGHTLITLAHTSTHLVSKMLTYVVKMLTKVLTWSKIVKIMNQLSIYGPLRKYNVIFGHF